MDGDDRYDLQERYLALTRQELPAAARRHGWVIRDDHCFMRVILDHLFQGCWYDYLDRRLRAYKQLNAEQLAEAVRLGDAMLAGGGEVVEQMNRASLVWRGKAR